MASMSDIDQRPYGKTDQFNTENECIAYFRKEEDSGKTEWLGVHGTSYPHGSKYWLADQIEDTADWLEEHQEHFERMLQDGYISQIDGLRAYAQQIRCYRGS
jgi:hypothetical protein